MKLKGWNKGNNRNTYWYSDKGDEIRITTGTHYNKPVYNIMMKKKGCNWTKFSHAETHEKAMKRAISFMKMKRGI